MPTTSPDTIFYEDGATGYSDATNAAMQATSIQAAFNKRQGYNFVWATQSDRTAQTGMSQGSTGYQLDTKSEYIYDNSAWRLKIPHAEYTSSQGVPNATLTLLGTMTVQSGFSTDTSFAPSTGTANGGITLARPGVYAATNTVNLNTVTTGPTLIDIATTPSDDTGLIVRQAIPASVSYGTVTIPNFYVSAANTTIYFKGYAVYSGTTTFTSRVRVTRLS